MNFSYDDVLDNLTNLTTGHSRYPVSNYFQYGVYGICFPILALIGLLANLASFIVLTRPVMRTSINMYLAGLSFFDGFLLFFSLLLFPPLAYCESYTLTPESQDFWCQYLFVTAPVSFPMTCIFQSGSVWTLVAITVDRFVAITWPLKARDVLTTQRSQTALIGVGVWSILYNIPTFFELEHDKNGNLQQSALRDNEMYVVTYKGYCYLFFMFLIPALSMIILNLFVTLAVQRAYRIRRQLSGREEKERRSTLTAILVVVTFLLLNLLVLLNNCLETFAPSFKMTKTFSMLVYVGNFLIAVNSATNFVIYCALGLRFRKMFCKLFFGFCCASKKEYKYMFAHYGSTKCNNLASTTGVGATYETTAVADVMSDKVSVRSFKPCASDSRPLLLYSPLQSPEYFRQRSTYRNDHFTFAENGGFDRLASTPKRTVSMQQETLRITLPKTSASSDHFSEREF